MAVDGLSIWNPSPPVPGIAMNWKRMLAFFALACGISWLLWFPLVAESFGWVDGPISPYWHLAGGLGPMLAAITVRYATAGPIRFQSIPGRLFGSPAQLRWIIVGLLGPIALFLIAALAIGITRGEMPDLSRFGESTDYPHLPLLGYWLANIIFYGFGEEVGWRGFALPRLSARYGQLLASWIVSLFWATWHLPLFFFADGLSGMSPANVIGWYLSLWVGSILFTWLYGSSHQSLLAVALFHGMHDISINSPVDDALQNVIGALVTIAGLGALIALNPAIGHAAERPAH